jgi:hypothetical protein
MLKGHHHAFNGVICHTTNDANKSSIIEYVYVTSSLDKLFLLLSNDGVLLWVDIRNRPNSKVFVPVVLPPRHRRWNLCIARQSSPVEVTYK